MSSNGYRFDGIELCISNKIIEYLSKHINKNKSLFFIPPEIKFQIYKFLYEKPYHERTYFDDIVVLILFNFFCFYS